jgi:hypothetical protein
MFEDIYFLNGDEALRVASEQNRWGENGYYLQACYYDGPKIESDLANLIHMPIENLIEGLAYGRYRIPTKIDFTSLELSSDIKYQVQVHFNISTGQATILRNQLNQKYLHNLKNAKLDFSEPLRFYLSASSSTQVMQYVSKAIADTLDSMGYDVMFDLYYGIEDESSLKNMVEFNPHAVINLNHINNKYISDDVFNIVWFQDPMPILYNNEELSLRKRDIIYSLLKEFDTPLRKKGVEVKRQNFCVNLKEFKIYDDIKRQKKIVFIGSSYGKMIPDDKNTSDAVEYITKAFGTGEHLKGDFIDKIVQNFLLDKEFVLARLIPFVVRDVSVLWLCNIESDYEIEIYGHGWDAYESVKPFYKGALKYGDDVAKVYNSATYSLAPHQNYILQQRVLEAAACGCIPIVYDIGEEKIYEESLEYFKTKDDLVDILSNNDLKEKNFDRLLRENSYKYFVDGIIKEINERIK